MSFRSLWSQVAVLAGALIVGTPITANAVSATPDIESYGNAGPLLRPRTPLPCQLQGKTLVNECVGGVGKKLTGEALRNAHVKRALVMLRLFKTAEAQAEMERALAFRPRAAATLHLAARMLLVDFTTEPKAVARAEVYVDEALRQKPTSSDLISTKAYILSLRGRMDRSMPLYEHAIARDTRNTFARQHRAVELVQRNRMKEAVEEYGRLIELQPEDGDWYAARGQLLLRSGDAKAAVADLDQALKLSPPNLQLYSARATALTIRGSLPEAIDDLTVLIDGTPDGMRFAVGGEQLANFLTTRGLLYYRSGRAEQAAADILRAVAQGGKSSVTRLQVYLAGRGLEVPVDGTKSPGLHAAVMACFADGDCANNIGMKL